MADIPILGGLGEIAGRYDALLCDVWGVLHNGEAARPPAVAALRRFRAQGPVILLSNAPRPACDLLEQFSRVGVPADCYDAIMTSGMAARQDLERRLAAGPVRMFHLGPERDRGVFDGLAVQLCAPDRADLILCTGLFDDECETPEDYRALLRPLAEAGVVFLCANPDLKVQRGARLVYCAGALAALYEELGGQVTYYGKPHRPIYDVTLAMASRLAGHSVAHPLAIGDGLKTDVVGANGVGIDVVFIADGVHGEDLGVLSTDSLARLFTQAGAHAVGAMSALMW
ncbi:MAG: TIGR01459 family HAD-type hydrolase [Alphaproteobacteria bacterium]|nr:TIGR01459 family HAD-type hydrolase [Alphaproteobacteria bacterium]